MSSGVMLRRGFAAMTASLLALAAPRARADDGAPKKPKTDVTLVPVAGGSSDFGWGGGVLGGIARVAPGVDPYVWRLELASTSLFKFGSGGVSLPYEDDYLKLSIPHLVPHTLGIEIRPSFTRESQLKYSGLGNASPPPLDENGNVTWAYGRSHPTLSLRARLELPAKLFLRTGVEATYNWVQIRQGSALARDLRSGSPDVRRALSGPTEHAVFLFEYALGYDTRDHRVSPKRGQFHEVGVRLSPAGSSSVPYRYGQANVTLRGYATPVRWLTITGRVVGDLIFGDAPFYELARYADTFAIGGGKGVRGVIAQRYYGKAKLFGNLEARTEVASFHVFGKEMALQVAAFFDAGRVWFDLSPHPELDGTSLGLKYGAGGGLRIRSGHAFVVRGDVAWSPDAYPVSGYFTAGQIF